MAEIDDLVDALDDLPPMPQPAVLPAVSRIEQDEQITTTFGIEAASIAQFGYYFHAAPHAFWEGALIQGESVLGGGIDLVPLDRAPLTLTLRGLELRKFGAVLEAGSPLIPRSTLVRSPSLETIDAARIELLQSHVNHTTQAAFAFSCVEYSSARTALLSLGVSADWANVVRLQAAFSSDTSTRSTCLVVNLLQLYYSFAINPPSSPAKAFEAAVTASELRRFTQPQAGIPNPPLLITSITYGRQLLLRARTSMKAEEFRVSFQASLKAVVSGSTSAEAAAKDFSESSSLDLVVLGGGADLAIQVGINIKDLANLLRGGSQFSADSPGEALFYTLNYLKNARQVVVRSWNDVAALTRSPLAPPPDVSVWVGAQGIAEVPENSVGWAGILGKKIDSFRVISDPAHPARQCSYAGRFVDFQRSLLYGKVQSYDNVAANGVYARADRDGYLHGVMVTINDPALSVRYQFRYADDSQSSEGVDGQWIESPIRDGLPRPPSQLRVWLVRR